MSNHSAQRYTRELLHIAYSLQEFFGADWNSITRQFYARLDETIRRYESHELDALAERARTAPGWAAFEVPECERVVYVGDKQSIDARLN